MTLRLKLFLLFSLSYAFGQDTIQVYFDYGSAKVVENYHASLNELAHSYDLTELDSVQFIGYADSTGNFRANMRLSQRRARNTYRFCKTLFSDEQSISILAKGEGTKNDLAENRRVDVVLFFPLRVVDTPDDIIENVDPKCFFVDFEALEYCNVSTFKKGKREYVRLEAMNVKLFTERKHYYVIRDYRDNATIQRLSWKLKTTGKLWWKKKRYVATLPKASFDQFQFFTLEDAPCTGCSEEIFTKDTIIMTTSKYYPDHFLMNNAQMKLRFWRANQVKIRVPKEYVDLSETYYLSYNRNYGVSRWGTVEWTTKKLGRKRQDYYYAKFHLYDGKLPYIFKNRMTTVCLNKYEGNGWYIPSWGPCLPPGYGWGLGLVGSLEPGVFYHNDTLTGYLAVGLSLINRNNINLQAGINSNFGFYGAFNYRFIYTSIPLRIFTRNRGWEDMTDVPFNLTYIHCYVGLDSKTSFNKKYQSFFESNLHAGLQLNRNVGGLFPRFYLQGGVSYDFLGRVNTEFYSYAQLGVRFYTRNFL